jgi:cell division protein FtsQ
VSSQNRSEEIRKRRTTRTQSHTERASRSASAPSITSRRAVSSRGVGMGKPVLQRTAVKPRRMYTVAVQNTGRAYSVPAPSIHLSWRTLSGALVLGMVALLVFLLNSDGFNIDKPKITGASRVSVNDIESVLKLNGKSIFAIDPGTASAELEKSFPELQNVKMSVGLPNTVGVSFSERQPVLAWKQKDKTSWVDSRGTIFSARGEPPANLLTITSESPLPLYVAVPTPGSTPTPGPTPKPGSPEIKPTTEAGPDRMDLAIMSSALMLSGQMPEKAKLIYAEKEGLGWHDSGGWDVYFGKTLDDLEMKISMVQAIINQLGQKGIKPKYVNLEFLHAPYYRLER